ncbi:MAG: 3-hydroxyacyl-ACP dehydratase FabZ [Thermodesulfobacteriota bacterium]
MSETVRTDELDILKIMELIPHRYPFIMVDRVLSVEGDSIVAIKNVSMNEPFFQGHFPEKPIMPGVLMLEGMAQAGGILAFVIEENLVGEKLLYFAGIDKARFRKPVIPGDQLTFKVEVLKKKRGIWKLAGKTFVGDDLVCEAEFMASFV